MAEMSHPEAKAEGLTQANEKRPVYEAGFHLAPAVPEEEVAAVVEKIRAAIGTEAEFIAKGAPAKMALAYVIERASGGKREKYAEAYFGWIKFATEREAIPALEATLRGMPEVLRFLLIETVREDLTQTPRRAVFASDRLEGQTLKKPTNAPERGGEVSEEELDKSIEALVS